MQAYEHLRQIADDWRRLPPNQRVDPAQRDELSRRTAECLAYLTGAQAKRDAVVVDMALARAIRLCERLARAIQVGVVLAEPSLARSERTAPPDATGPVTVGLRFGVGATVEIRGRVERRELARALRELDRMIVRADGALLVDARDVAGYAPECAQVLAEWVAMRGGMNVRRVAVVVAQRAQFVRASRALANATGVAWLIAHERDAAEQWLATPSAATTTTG